MAQILIRGLTDSEVGRLREHARRHDRSLEAEARLAIRQAAQRPTYQELQDFAAWTTKMRAKLAGKVKGDSADIIRTAREERDRRLDARARDRHKKSATRAR